VKTLGGMIMKKIDNLGRIVIPKSLRIKYNIKNGEDLEITDNKNGILIKKSVKTVELLENDIKFLKEIRKLIEDKDYKKKLSEIINRKERRCEDVIQYII
jgi:AbrB family looped-hinge helix DNA binding protein